MANSAVFTVTVVNKRVNESMPDRQVSAEAGRYLGYADHTDLFGYKASIVDVVVSEGQLLVKFTFEAPVAQESDITDFLDECESLERVKNAECLTNPNL